MHLKRLTMLIAPALLLPAAARAQSAADTASVQSFYNAWFGSAGQSPEAYAGFYAADGFVLPPDGPPVRGRADIADWLRRARAQSPFTLRPEGISVDEIRFLGDSWVVYRSTLRGQRIPKAGSDPVPFATKYFDLLERGENGNWRVRYRMWSDNG